MLTLPIDSLLPDIVASLAKRPRLVLEAPPGAGKTTRVPRALLDAGVPGEIVVLEPRRLAARLAARRVADELGERLGGTVGYTVRFEDQSSPQTRIRFVTEGVLARRLVRDPELVGIGAVLLDEFHERHLQGDVALAMLTRLQRSRRPDLRLVAMSATLDAAPLAAWMDAPHLRAEGRRFDVAVEHMPTSDERPLPSLVASAVRRLVLEGLDGDVLVFLPGAAEIRKCLESCAKAAAEADLLLLALHGDLSPAEQDRVLAPSRQRKIILATNVAESSVTIDGVVAVVDGGLARVAAHSAWSGVSTLRVERVSRASAIQRAGRAGRTRPGRCLRLFTRSDFEARPEHDLPEIRRLDLAQTMLELAAAGASDLDWFEAPPAPAVAAALELLARLGALDPQGHVTPIGQAMLQFPLHPRQARLVVEGQARGVGDDACLVAALLSERDFRLTNKARFDGPRGRSGGATSAATERSDVLAMRDLFREAEAFGFAANTLRSLELDPGTTLAVHRAYGQLKRGLGRGRDVPMATDDSLLLAILAGYPDRVARRTRTGGRALALSGGGSADLSEASTVRDAPWLVALVAQVGMGGTDGGAASERRGGAVNVRLASAIEPEWLIELYAELLEESTAVRWNSSAERVECSSRLAYQGLVLSESAASGDDAETARVLAEAALARGVHAFAADGALSRWLARARFTATTTGAFPAPGPDAVSEALVALCQGRRSFAELREVSLLDGLKAALGHAHAALVERTAPERVTLPAGRTQSVGYDDGKPPWLESFLQDFFGTVSTPKIAEGKVPLVVHLLAPNKRAVQVTTDLAGFWERHYPAVRKELMRKYPRHQWPEDPTTAAPILRMPRR